MQLHKTDKARLELAKGTRTLGQRDRTLLLLADGRKTVADFERQFGPGVVPTLRELVANGYLVEKSPASVQASGVPAAARSLPDFAQPRLASVAQSVATALVAHGNSKVNLLIVDDSEVARRAMLNQLQPYAASVYLAPSGKEALELLCDVEFDIVFLDIMMADMDGYQTCRAIKHFKSKSGKVPAVVMQSSKGGVLDKIRGTMARADGYLTKPLHSGQVADILRKFAPTAVGFAPSIV